MHIGANKPGSVEYLTVEYSVQIARTRYITFDVSSRSPQNSRGKGEVAMRSRLGVEFSATLDAWSENSLTTVNGPPGWDAAQVGGLVREESLLERLAGIVQILPLDESISARSNVQMEEVTEMSTSNSQHGRSGFSCLSVFADVWTNTHCGVCLEEAKRYRECSD